MQFRLSGHSLSPKYRHGRGMVICECGAHSPTLPSKFEQNEWHRQHIADVLAGKTQLP